MQKVLAIISDVQDVWLLIMFPNDYLDGYIKLFCIDRYKYI